MTDERRMLVETKARCDGLETLVFHLIDTLKANKTLRAREATSLAKLRHKDVAKGVRLAFDKKTDGVLLIATNARCDALETVVLRLIDAIKDTKALGVVEYEDLSKLMLPDEENTNHLSAVERQVWNEYSEYIVPMAGRGQMQMWVRGTDDQIFAMKDAFNRDENGITDEEDC